MSQRGFTLIEVMVAMVIFAIISTMTFQALQTSMQVQQRVEAKAAAFKDVQLLMSLLHDDFAHLVRRPARDMFGNSRRPAFMLEADTQETENKLYSNCQVEFSRSGSPQGSQELRSGLVRVAYCLDQENDLYRLLWPIMDRAQDSVAIESFLVASVSEFSIELGEDDIEQLAQYCDYGVDNLPPECLEWLPSGVISTILVFETQDGELKFTRDFPVGMGLYLWKLTE